MPQGKGTYGSQVGRPSKKQKYQVGGEVSGSPEAEAVLEAAQMGQELESIPLGGIEPDFPMSNAMERSETYQLGGMIEPPTTPNVPSYEKGGEVGNVKGEKADVTDVVKKVSQLEKLKKMHKGKAGRKGSNLKKQARRMAREVIEQSVWQGEDWGKEKNK